MIPLEIFPTGWFHVGWTAELAPGAVRPMRYFGEELAAFRSESGELAILDAHCAHLGAHLGYGGKVRGDCVVCPYHGWSWNTDGENTHVPYQDQPTRKRLRRWPTLERHGMIFVWYDPTGAPPRWDLPDLFRDVEGLEASEADYYPCYPHATIDKPGEPFPVQFMMENAADTTHFQFTHRSPEAPELLEFGPQNAVWWKSVMGFLSPKTKQVAMTLNALHPNIGLVFTVFNGREPYRLILAGTPVDRGDTHIRVSYFLPRVRGSWDEMPEETLRFAQSTEELYEEDARMWRHQRFMQKPVFAARDVAGYSAFRKWSQQFYAGAAPNLSVSAE